MIVTKHNGYKGYKVSSYNKFKIYYWSQGLQVQGKIGIIKCILNEYLKLFLLPNCKNKTTSQIRIKCI